MVANQAIRSCIRENKAHQIYSLIQTGGKYGMKTGNQSLFELYESGAITYDEAMARTTDPEDLKRTFQRGVTGPAVAEKPAAAAAAARRTEATRRHV
jgi:twitching motility protein PilT